MGYGGGGGGGGGGGSDAGERAEYGAGYGAEYGAEYGAASRLLAIIMWLSVEEVVSPWTAREENREWRNLWTYYMD